MAKPSKQSMEMAKAVRNKIAMLYIENCDGNEENKEIELIAYALDEARKLERIFND